MNTNLSNFKSYLKNQYHKKVVRHYVNKQNIDGNVEKGIIFTYEETLAPPEWVGYLNDIAEKKNIKVPGKRISRAVLFLTLKGTEKTTFAITFGNGATLLESSYIVSDFGLKVSKSLLSINELISVDSTSIDRKIFNTKKQSAAFLMPEKMLEYGAQSIVRNIHGVFKEFNKKFSLGGNESLNFKGDINLLTDIEKWLTQFASLYSAGQNNLGVFDDLTIVSADDRKFLDKKLGEKILEIIAADPITQKQISSLKISPSVTFDLNSFNGFFISGLGYKRSKLSSDFLINEVDFFERFKRKLKSDQKDVDGVLSKIKTATIHRQSDVEGEYIPICSIYKAIHYETTYGSKQYILVSGTWYEIDKDFYNALKKDIDSIESPDAYSHIQYINFDNKKHRDASGNKSEGKYNEDLAAVNHVLMLDRQNYRLDKKTMQKYGFKPNSPIELCDLLYFDKNKIQFIHIKRHSGASGTSHLLSQAIVSAHAFINDNTSVVSHINQTIEEFNNQNHPYSFRELHFEEQRKEIVLAIIDKKSTGKNSRLLSLLEMISLRENIRNLESLGFKCYLKFIPVR